MRVALDARLALTNSRGHGRYILGLCKGLLEIDARNEYILYVDAPDAGRVFSKMVNAHLRILRPSVYPLWEQYLLPRQLIRDRVDLVHFSNHTAPLYCPVPSVVTIHDTIYLDGTPWRQPLRQQLGRVYKRLTAPRSARYSRKVIAVSEFCRSELVNRLAIPEEKIVVTYEGIDPAFRPMPPEEALERVRRFGLDNGSYLLCLGGFDPRKNTGAIIEAYKSLLGMVRIELKLVIAGLNQGDLVKIAPHAIPLVSAGSVIPLGFVTDEELVALYNLASVFLYVSRAEGFGIPVLEAMACGTPVVASNTTSIPEVAGEAALLVDPDSVEQIAQAAYALLTELALRTRCISAGKKRVERFSWLEVARRTLQIYERVVQEIARGK